MIMSTERGAWRCGEVRTSITVVFMGAPLCVGRSADAARRSACATWGSCAGLPFAVQLLCDPEILHQWDVRGADICAAAALETVVDVELGLHFFVARFARQHPQTGRIQMHRARRNALSALDARVDTMMAIRFVFR